MIKVTDNSSIVGDKNKEIFSHRLNIEKKLRVEALKKDNGMVNNIKDIMDTLYNHFNMCTSNIQPVIQDQILI